mmetsp:Transcript_11099/g.38653  ORF Transcript_11099/g.38653 Transcript_11099/m.38653 type:complete len:253 (-) Transcript_11099:216-974(-)
MAFQVDAAAVALQHVQSEQEVHVVLVKHREGAREVLARDDEAGHVHAADDLGGAHADGLASVACVDESHDAATLGAALAHDRALRAAVNERVHLDAVHHRRDVQHRHLDERFRHVLVRELQVALHVLLPDRVRQPRLQLRIKRIVLQRRPQRRLLHLALHLLLRAPHLLLQEHAPHHGRVGVVARRGGQLRIMRLELPQQMRVRAQQRVQPLGRHAARDVREGEVGREGGREVGGGAGAAACASRRGTRWSS